MLLIILGAYSVIGAVGIATITTFNNSYRALQFVINNVCKLYRTNGLNNLCKLHVVVRYSGNDDDDDDDDDGYCCNDRSHRYPGPLPGVFKAAKILIWKYFEADILLAHVEKVLLAKIFLFVHCVVSETATSQMILFLIL